MSRTTEVRYGGEHLKIVTEMVEVTAGPVAKRQWMPGLTEVSLDGEGIDPLRAHGLLEQWASALGVERPGGEDVALTVITPDYVHEFARRVAEAMEAAAPDPGVPDPPRDPWEGATVSLKEHNVVFGVLSQLYAAAIQAGVEGAEVDRARGILFPPRDRRTESA